MDVRLRPSDPADRRLRRAVVVLARARRGGPGDRGDRCAAATAAAPRALDLSRRGPLRAADRGDRAYLDRCRRRAALVGAAAVALSAHLGAGVPVAPAAAAQMDPDAAARGDR